MSRVLCASCRRRFDAARPTPGAHLRCTRCGATVQVGARVAHRRIEASSRGALAAWMDDGRSDATDAMLRAVVVIAIAGSALSGLIGLARGESASGGPGGSPVPTAPPADEPVVRDSSGEW